MSSTTNLNTDILEYLNYQINADEIKRKKADAVTGAKISRQEILGAPQISTAGTSPDVANSITITIPKSGKKVNPEVVGAAAGALHELADTQVTEQMRTSIKNSISAEKIYDNNGLKISTHPINGSAILKLSGVTLSKEMVAQKLAAAKAPPPEAERPLSEHDRRNNLATYYAERTIFFIDAIIDRKISEHNNLYQRKLMRGDVTTLIQEVPSGSGGEIQNPEQRVLTINANLDNNGMIRELPREVLRHIGIKTQNAEKSETRSDIKYTLNINVHDLSDRLKNIDRGLYDKARIHVDEKNAKAIGGSISVEDEEADGYYTGKANQDKLNRTKPFTRGQY